MSHRTPIPTAIVALKFVARETPNMGWIFGYGSLIWRPGFIAERRMIARLDGWERVFSQGSPDHRGTPEKPGRVVNLHPRIGHFCWGMAFEVNTAEWPSILTALDRRESGGYAQQRVTVEREDGAFVSCITYIAPPSNRFHLGLAPMTEMAEQIRLAQGPSGPNRQYVFELESALKHLAIEDHHVTQLARALKASIDQAEAEIT